MQEETFQMIDELLALRIDAYINYRNAVSVFAGGILLLLGYLFCGFDMSVRKRMYQLNSLMVCVAKEVCRREGAVMQTMKWAADLRN